MRVFVGGFGEALLSCSSSLKNTHMSMLVPSALNAAFRLRTGVLQFGNYRAHTLSGDFKTGVADQIGVHSPELLSLLLASLRRRRLALEILTSLNSPKGLGRVDLPFDKEYNAWKKNELLS
jgi:hypothetical protein